jgi:hypothetical protein
MGPAVQPTKIVSGVSYRLDCPRGGEQKSRRPVIAGFLPLLYLDPLRPSARDGYRTQWAPRPANHWKGSGVTGLTPDRDENVT